MRSPHSLHLLAMVLSMASPMRSNLRGEADRNLLDFGIEAGLFEEVSLFSSPSHITMDSRGKEMKGVQLTREGRELAARMRVALNSLTIAVDQYPADLVPA